MARRDRRVRRKAAEPDGLPTGSAATNSTTTSPSSPAPASPVAELVPQPRPDWKSWRTR
ncbi:hypothetical protein I552_0062 [Mycobacterium xenopi 3993]|nr:hypothetical protein I552_0062 [Mycobacterium xenopi 3993]